MYISRGLFMSLLVFALSIYSCDTKKDSSNQPISNWQFKNDTSQTWLPATVPGCVQTDLLVNKKIPDPFFGDNEKHLQWIGKTDWTYQTTFSANDILENDHVELVFDGLDTYANVFLNDSLILVADNMFRQWTIEVKNLLKKSQNKLQVNFTAPEKIEQVKAAALSYQLPDPRGFTRKAPYQYGWDWGPKFVTQGIWKPVYLTAWNDIRIIDLHAFAKKITTDTAIVKIEAIIESDDNQKVSLQLRLNGKSYSEKFTLGKGKNIYRKAISINEPKLWWPNGMGDHPLYILNFEIDAGKTTIIDSARFGIRNIELVQEKDSIGESFYFKINSVPFFAKGANYIPQDNFPARVSDDKYRNTIQNAVDANMNMLRVWGGGIYEKDIFYDLCDKNGILVWQDFMFACNMYPGDSAFLNNVKEEAAYQVKRLRNHPSLALWCGNNEVSEGWFNWGWQQSLGYSKADSTELWHNYQKIFEEILPNTIQKYDPVIAYYPSSPKIGWGHEEALKEGDMHYWGVWWGEEPFEMYDEKVGRFMSEYGFQGFPDLRTLDSCLMPQDRSLDSPELLNHEKHPRGMELIRTYMKREYPVPNDFEDYDYVSQLVQAYGIRTAIEAHRRAMPRCMGSLYWQLNDCWPAISWSSIDYYNRWKALHYFVRDAFKDILISFNQEEMDSVEVYVVSDLQEDLPIKLDLKMLNFEGDVIWQKEKEIQLKKTSSEIYESVDVKDISKENHLLSARAFKKDTLIAGNLYYFLPTKDLHLPEVQITQEIIPEGDGFTIILTTDKLAKNVFLSSDLDGHFSDNYFDLLPGENITVHFTPQIKTNLTGLNLEVRSF